jgi:hypothetical protein
MDHDANLVGADPAFTPSLCRPDVRKPAAATLLLPVLRERISAALSIVFFGRRTAATLRGRSPRDTWIALRHWQLL